MLNSFQSKKDKSPAAAPLFLQPVCICIFVVVGACAVVGMVVISLIPSFTKNRAVEVSGLHTCVAQKIVYVLPKNLTVPDGPISPNASSELQAIIQSRLKSTSLGSIPGSKIMVNDGQVAAYHENSKMKRDTTEWRMNNVEGYAIQIGDQLLTINCQLIVPKQHKYVCTKTYQQFIRDFLTSLPIPDSILKDIIFPTRATTAATSTASTCSDTDGYTESGTGNTCQTYIDYGYCADSEVISDTLIDTTSAKANCCACGKGSSSSGHNQ